MTKQFMTLAATAAMVLAFSPQAFAQVDEELELTANGVTATITLSTSGELSVTCTGTTAQCGDFTTQSTAGKHLFGSGNGVISDDGQNGTITVSGPAVLNGYTITDTAVGWADSSAPTLQNFNQTDADGGIGTVTAEFTDIDYNTPGTPLAPVFNTADSNTNAVQIASSTVQFSVYSDGTNHVPALDLLYTNTLTGHSASNGANGVDEANPNTTGSVSISSETVMNFTGDGEIQASMTVANVSVPEPAGIVLLGTMVLGLTGLIRRKQVKRS